jgi:type IV secretory pathway TrbF-like protein
MMALSLHISELIQQSEREWHINWLYHHLECLACQLLTYWTAALDFLEKASKKKGRVIYLLNKSFY